MTALPADILKGMAQIGLSDELLGRAVRELLSAETKRASTPLRAAHQQEPRASTDVSTPRYSAPSPTPPSPPLSGKSSEASEDDLVPLKVRFPSGGATNVVVPRLQLTQLAKTLGADEEAARRWVREKVQAAPPGISNRSRWVQQQIAEFTAPRPRVPN